MIEGRHYLLPDDVGGSALPEAREIDGRTDLPWVQLSSTFVRQWKGAGWLKKSRPVAPGFQRIEESERRPVASARVKAAQGGEPLLGTPATYVPLFPAARTVEFGIEPDRDLNGAGLLYFANYALFLDLTERRILTEIEKVGFDHDQLDGRTLEHRRSAYFSNASARDTLRIEMQGWIENPFEAGTARPGSPPPEEAPVRLLLQFRMHRASDERLMLACSARKVFPMLPLNEARCFDALRSGKPLA